MCTVHMNILMAQKKIPAKDMKQSVVIHLIPISLRIKTHFISL